MPYTQAQLEFIENAAQEQHKYQTIFAYHCQVLQTDPVKYEAAMQEVQRSSVELNPGKCWERAQEDLEKYLGECDAICQTDPQGFEELSLFYRALRVLLSDKLSHVKIVLGAYTALVILLHHKVGKESQSVQLAILDRVRQLRST